MQVSAIIIIIKQIKLIFLKSVSEFEHFIITSSDVLNPIKLNNKFRIQNFVKKN